MKHILVLALFVSAIVTLSAQGPVRLDTRLAQRIWFQDASYEMQEGSDPWFGPEMEGISSLCSEDTDLIQILAANGRYFFTLKNSHLRQIHDDSTANLFGLQTMFDFQNGRPTKVLERVRGSYGLPSQPLDVGLSAYECNGENGLLVSGTQHAYCMRSPSGDEPAFTFDLVGDDSPDLIVRANNDDVWYNVVPNGSPTPFECDQMIHIPSVPGRALITATVTDGEMMVIARDTSGAPTDKMYAMELSVVEHSPDSVEFKWRDFASLSLRCDGCEKPLKWFASQDGLNGDVYVYRSFKDGAGVPTTIVDRLSQRRLERITHITKDLLDIYGTIPGSQLLGVPLAAFTFGWDDKVYLARLDNLARPFGYAYLDVPAFRLKQLRIIRDGTGDGKPDVLHSAMSGRVIPFVILNIYEMFELGGPTSVFEHTPSDVSYLHMRGTTLVLDGSSAPSTIEIYNGLGSLESQQAIPGGEYQYDIAPHLAGKAPGIRMVVRRTLEEVRSTSFMYVP